MPQFPHKAIPHRIPLSDFVIAYRHTKAELFAERSIPSRLALLDYEKDLVGNLKRLQSQIELSRLINNQPSFLTPKFLGKIVRQPKEIKPTEGKDSAATDKQPHLYQTDAIARWETFKSQKRPIADFRTMAIPSIDFQILGMLWIMKVGHHLDEKLLPESRGNRLQRIARSSDDLDELEPLPLNDESPHIFRPYHSAYRNWRRDGLNAIEGEIEEGRRVIALTMDLKRYYHQIDPSFLNNAEFWTETFGIDLTSEQWKLTKLFTSALVGWSRRSPERSGIPVGLLASKIIANALLHAFDRAVSDELNPVFYARYVDDVLLVIRPPKKAMSATEVIGYVSTELGDLAEVPKEGSTFSLKLRHVGKSKLEFGAAKQRIFDFQGESGKDLLNTIRKEIDELSSEFRLMPDVSESDGSVLKQVLTADHDLEVGADSLRKADSLTVRRLGLAILLRNHELLERCMNDPKQWELIRMPFYDLIHEHVLTPERFSTFFQYLPQVFGLIAANGDWAIGEKLLKRLDWVQKEIESLTEESSL
jgi:hypothetical protein